MRMHIIFGHRVESYEGEFNPEPLDIFPDVTVSEAPELIQEALDKHRELGEFKVVEMVVVEVDGDKLMGILYPPKETLKGRIVVV